MKTPQDDDRRLTLAPEPAEPSGLAPVVGQMLFMPLTMMMYGLNLLARTARGAPTGGVPGAGRRAAPGGEPHGYAEPGLDHHSPQVAPPSGWSTLQPGWRRPNLELVRGESSQQTHHQERRNSERHEPTGSEEQRSMVDNKNLQDDMLKTVRYWISFEKRDYEAVLHDGIDHVYDNLTDAQFTAWKMAEFMQKLKSTDDHDRIKIPFAWQKKVTFFTKDPNDKFVVDFDHKDKKYLTVDWEVVGRVVRRKGRFDERKTEALETIAEHLEHCCDGKIQTTVVVDDK